MEKIKLNDTLYEVPGNGIGYSTDALSVTFVADKLEVSDLQAILENHSGDFELLDEAGTEVEAVYKGYTKLDSIRKSYNVVISEDLTADTLTFIMLKPTLTDKVEQNAEDITAINDAIAALAEIVG